MSAREVYDYAQVSYEQGRTADRTVEEIALVFTCTWPLRKRLALAWRLVTKR